ncbi:hypothetical protein XF14_07185, partial [Burkholderia gladioli]
MRDVVVLRAVLDHRLPRIAERPALVDGADRAIERGHRAQLLALRLRPAIAGQVDGVQRVVVAGIHALHVIGHLVQGHQVGARIVGIDRQVMVLALLVGHQRQLGHAGMVAIDVDAVETAVRVVPDEAVQVVLAHHAHARLHVLALDGREGAGLDRLVQQVVRLGQRALPEPLQGLGASGTKADGGAGQARRHAERLQVLGAHVAGGDLRLERRERLLARGSGALLDLLLHRLGQRGHLRLRRAPQRAGRVALAARALRG